MASKTKIKNRTRKKTNSDLVETIALAIKKNENEIAKILSGPTRNLPAINLGQINEKAKDGETIIIPGKVLSYGNVDKKIRVVAYNFSSVALDKLKKAKCELSTIREELENNKKISGKILK
jgi:large subunit ribosomal protein L18e